MSVEESVVGRLTEVIAQSKTLSVGNQWGQCVDEAKRARCSAWLSAAQNAVHLISPSANAPYRQKAGRIASAEHGFGIHQSVGELAAVLEALIVDTNAGLLASVADRARAETFDDFLDHADAYLRDGRKDEGGVIAGVCI